MPSNESKPLIVAHRGLHAEYPENSLGAFRAAWDAGITWCECDVQMTRCFTTVVLHDNTLDRTTTLAGPVGTQAWWDVSQARLRLADGTPTDERLPALEFVTVLMDSFNKREFSKHLLIEIKAPCNQVLPIGVADKASPKTCAIQSFDSSVLMSAHVHNRYVPVYLLVEDLAAIARNLDAPWNGINIPHDLLTGEIVERLHARRKSIGVWTPNTDADLLRAIELGVDMIITDEPLRAMQLLKSHTRQTG